MANWEGGGVGGETSEPGASGTARPENPESLSFSTPTARTMSYIPAATAKAALRKASVAVAQAFSTLVMGM